MKQIVVKLSGMPFDPTYQIDDDTIAIRAAPAPPAHPYGKKIPYLQQTRASPAT